MDSAESPFAPLHDGNTYKLLINGAFHASNSGKSITNQTPYDGTTSYVIQACTRDEIDAAYQAAHDAQKSWAFTPLWKRAEYLHKAAAVLRANADEIATAIVREVAKGRKSAKSEVVRTADLVDYTAEQGVRAEGQLLTSDSFVGQERNKMCLVQRVPLGVVLCAGPFNYP